MKCVNTIYNAEYDKNYTNFVPYYNSKCWIYEKQNYTHFGSHYKSFSMKCWMWKNIHVYKFIFFCANIDIGKTLSHLQQWSNICKHTISTHTTVDHIAATPTLLAWRWVTLPIFFTQLQKMEDILNPSFDLRASPTTQAMSINDTGQELAQPLHKTGIYSPIPGDHTGYS